MSEETPITDAMRADAKSAVLRLKTLNTTIRDIRAFLAEEHPEMWAQLVESENQLKSAGEDVKDKVRALGPGTHIYGATSIRVRNASEKILADAEGLVDRAEAEGDIEDLMEAGVLVFKVIPHQVARLNGVQHARYSTYLTKKKGTMSVLLPPELK